MFVINREYMHISPQNQRINGEKFFVFVIVCLLVTQFQRESLIAVTFTNNKKFLQLHGQPRAYFNININNRNQYKVSGEWFFIKIRRHMVFS